MKYLFFLVKHLSNITDSINLELLIALLSLFLSVDKIVSLYNTSLDLSDRLTVYAEIDLGRESSRLIIQAQGCGSRWDIGHLKACCVEIHLA